MRTTVIRAGWGLLILLAIAFVVLAAWEPFDVTLELGSSDRPVDLLREGVECVIRGGDVHDESLVGRKLNTFEVVTCASPASADRGRLSFPFWSCWSCIA